MTETNITKIAGHSLNKMIAKESADVKRMSFAKMLHKRTERRARSYERNYSLSVESINAKLVEVEDRCELTGIRFDYEPKETDAFRRPEAPSLDRIDNKGGYDAGNVRIVCVCVNIAINEWGLKNFERMCRAYVKRNG